MRKILLILTVIFLVSMITACSDNSKDNMDKENTDIEQNNSELENDVTNDTVNNDEHTDVNDENTNSNDSSSSTNSNDNSKKYDDAVDDNGDVTEKMKKQNIEKIEIELEYANDQEYEAEIELKSDGTYTAELEDDLNDEYLKGQEAFNKLYPLVEKLDLNPNTSKDDVFHQVLEAFNLDSDYEGIEVEVEFYNSNKELEFEEK